MKVIGAGFGRTGTLSVKAALEMPGFGPCYHLLTAFELLVLRAAPTRDAKRALRR
ncbi:hypothetical protein L3Q67_32455 [Saccharothrix sp. AJ9571]|nr:hypothetical protein L3Q67_32455 [Saccharothrix sp. AJ9571]